MTTYIEDLDALVDDLVVGGGLTKNSFFKSATSNSCIFPLSVPRIKRSSDSQAWQR